MRCNQYSIDIPEHIEGTLALAEGGQRLDAALAHLLPGLSVRARRRVWETGRVLVNGRPRPPGYTVRAGDSVRVEYVPSATSFPRRRESSQNILSVYEVSSDTPVPYLLTIYKQWLFFAKPAGLHTVALAGQFGHHAQASLEAHLPRLVQDIMPDGTLPLLCTRLDRGTSGIVVGARDAAALAHWRLEEDAGRCEKIYLALLCGHLPAPITATAALDTRRTAVTRVLPYNAPPLRHTVFTPLRCGSTSDFAKTEDIAQVEDVSPYFAHALQRAAQDTPLTLARVTIYKGARHQIRAHAAHVGHPLWGDVKYGEGNAHRHNHTGDGLWVLHHSALHLPEFVVRCARP